MQTHEIRERFINHYVKAGHAEVPSASLILDDPNLLFVNAGMVPFKPYFLGEQNPPFPNGTATIAAERTLLESQLGAGVGVVESTSLGRIFDAAAVLAGCGENWDDGAVSYEAQAAMEFEQLARGAEIDIVRESRAHTAAAIPELFVELADADTGTPAVRALRFHVGLARIIGAYWAGA